MEGRTAGEPFRIPIDVPLKFFRRPLFPIIRLRQREMMTNHALPLVQRRSHSSFFPALRILKTEDPRISQSPSPDHHPVTTCLFEHLPDQEGRGDIPISDHRDMDRPFDFPDQIPVRLAAKSLRSCPGMDRKSIDATALCNF